MSDIYSRNESIREQFLNKRNKAETLADKRKSELYTVIPGLREIDEELAKTGMQVMSAALSGGDVEKNIEKLQKRNGELRDARRKLLVENGYPADYTDIRFECEKCCDTGFVGLKMCSCMREAMADAALRDSGLGKLAASETFDSFCLDYYRPGEERDAAEHNLEQLRCFAEGFSDNNEDSWLLLGNTGLGKTHLSTAVAVTVIRRGYDVVYCTIQSLINDFQDVQFNNASAGKIRKYYDCDLLIIDDLGAELTNQFTVSCLYNVINTRMNVTKSTVISTNLTQKAMRERYDDRITSRLFGTFNALLFVGTDVRRQKLSDKTNN